MQREQKQRRENHVTMYRKYRIGDLPDIQIKHSYVIAPLQALAQVCAKMSLCYVEFVEGCVGFLQRDSTVARLLFGAVFNSIFAQLEAVKTERECSDVCAQINSSLGEMLSSSTQYFAPFVGCVMVR